MNTCIVLEINNKKAIVLLPGGEITQVTAKSNWKVGQTVSVPKRTGNMKRVFAMAACVTLVFAALTSFAFEYMKQGSEMRGSDLTAANFGVVESHTEISDENYNNVFNLLKKTLGEGAAENNYNREPLASEGNLPETSIAAESAPITADLNSDISGVYSKTNIQVEGIDEADIIKTDGEYIYALNSKNLVILKSNDGYPKVVSKLNQEEDDDQYIEMYVTEHRLIAIKNSRFSKTGGEENPLTQIDIFDISNPQKPDKMSTFSQSGTYAESRMAEGYLYLISNHIPDSSNLDRKIPETFLPKFDNGSQKTYEKPGNIHICPTSTSPSYTVIGSINVNSAKDFFDTKSILGDTGSIYVSGENIYMSTESNEPIEGKEQGAITEVNATQLTKLTYKSGRLGRAKNALIPGLVQNQFFMDEYKGNLRVVTHVYQSRKTENVFADSYSALFTLDENLNELGKIMNIAPEEDLYSCRFMEGYAYFVTFRQVDPLFSADLRNPKSPKIVGKLKIPGFSEYLHPYDDGLLLGVGNDADEDTGVVGGIKLSMFDSSDPGDVREKHTLILENYDYSEVADNHKAILVDSEKKLIAFPSNRTYLVFTYDRNSGFKQVAKMSYEIGADYGYMENAIRGLFIDKEFYIITPDIIKTFNMDNGFKEKTTLEINRNAKPISPYYGLYDEFLMID